VAIKYYKRYVYIYIYIELSILINSKTNYYPSL